MFFSIKLLAILVAVFTVVLTGVADAQHLSLGFGKHGKHKSFSIQVSSYPRPHASPSYAPHYGYGGGCGTWIPGRYETRYEQVWVPGVAQKVWSPPVYETRYDSCGRPYTVLVRAGCWQVVQHPGRYEPRPVQVWVAGHWKGGY